MTMVRKKLPIKYLIQKFSELRNQVCDLDNGGCGIFATLLYERLKAEGYQPRIATITSDVRGVRMNFKKGYDPTPYQHFIVKVGRNYIDPFIITTKYQEFAQSCNRAWIGTKATYVIGYDLLKQWCEDPRAWNYKFDRSQRGLMECFFKELEFQKQPEVKTHWLEAMTK